MVKDLSDHVLSLDEDNGIYYKLSSGRWKKLPNLRPKWNADEINTGTLDMDGLNVIHTLEEAIKIQRRDAIDDLDANDRIVRTIV
jgi:hypothetical protein